MGNFLLGSLATLLSATLGYWSGYLKKRMDDRARRRGVATALLAELRILERMLRTRAEHAKAADSTVTIAMPVYDRFESDVLLFPIETTQLLLELRAFVRDIELIAALRKDGEQSDRRAHHYVRLKASGAANLIPRIKRVLEAAGGVAPADPPIESYDIDELPPLMAPAFPNAARLSNRSLPPAI
jgi:hypothetical protein